MKKIYLDSCILVAHFTKRNDEVKRKKQVNKCLEVFADSDDVQFCTSHWSIAEMVKILLRRKKMRRYKVSEIQVELLNNRRIKDTKIEILDVSSNQDYDFTEFFDAIRKGISKYTSGVPDIMHSIIMKNNGVKHILTFDEKDDFKQIPGLIVIHPKTVVSAIN